jgi:Arc/MetJ family transcription regulator
MGSSVGTHRTTIDIDVAVYQRARGVLGTRGYKDTVNEALRAVDRAAQLRRAADAIRAASLDVVTPEELAELRRPRA